MHALWRPASGTETKGRLQRPMNQTMNYLVCICCLLGLVLVGCGDSPSSGTEARRAVSKSVDGPSTVEDAQSFYTRRCGSCHGPTGRGDGPAGRALHPRPRSFQKSVWQAGVSDRHLRKVILGGGASVGLSPLMPPNPDLRDRPETIAGLIRIIRAFNTPKGAVDPE